MSILLLTLESLDLDQGWIGMVYDNAFDNAVVGVVHADLMPGGKFRKGDRFIRL